MSSSQMAMTVTILDSAMVEKIKWHEWPRLTIKQKPMSRLGGSLRKETNPGKTTLKNRKKPSESGQQQH